MIPSNQFPVQVGQRDRLVEMVSRLDVLMHLIKREADEFQSLRVTGNPTNGSSPMGEAAYLPDMDATMGGVDGALRRAHDQLSGGILLLTKHLRNEDGLRGVLCDGTWGGRVQAFPAAAEKTDRYVIGLELRSGRISYFVSQDEQGGSLWNAYADSATVMTEEEAKQRVASLTGGYPASAKRYSITPVKPKT